ncbi:hypothetical protein [Anabaena subtropica]|uniref:Uncharacterized protein n=1 Tax=Anabaena subtropica FACHB-260 TaxID=2692884 RepID=A0ABR8CIE5_9NOST|nr:hypothetical protein [Anabaena subtropica]MBD2343006.1 hypothetical protein [Anabaena subtropica FACHB-260]
MANITIDTLYLTGYDLLCDFESFLNELFPEEMSSIQGGFWGKSSGYNSFSGGGFSGHSGSYNSFSGGSFGYGGYRKKFWY